MTDRIEIVDRGGHWRGMLNGEEVLLWSPTDNGRGTPGDGAGEVRNSAGEIVANGKQPEWMIGAIRAGKHLPHDQREARARR